MAMKQYQRNRVRNARQWMDNYKRTTPCVKCGMCAFLPTQAFFVLKPETTYRRKIAALVSGGASEGRLLRAAQERDLLCEGCFRALQREAYATRMANRPSREQLIANATKYVEEQWEAGNTYKNASKCKPPTEYMLNMFASHGMNIKFFGTCLEPEHPYDACLYAIFDTATGAQLSADEWRAKMGLLPE